MIFNLECWGDGIIRLVHWDLLHGNDIVFVLRTDGVYKSIPDDQLEVVDDLATELRLLSEKGFLI